MRYWNFCSGIAYQGNAPFVPPLVWQSKHATPRLGFSNAGRIVSLKCCFGHGVSNSRKPKHPRVLSVIQLRTWR